MIEAERLLSWLDGRPVSGKVQVVGWRVEVARSETLRVGVRASRLGGPYEAPGHASRLSGSLDLHWSDGRLTRTQLDREQIGDPEAALANWVAEATPRIRLPSLAGPATPPAVQAYDPDLARAVEREPRALLDLVRPELGGASLARRPRLDATMRAMAGSRAVATSAGFRCAWDDTAHSLDAWIDEAARARFGLRRLPTEAEIASLYGDALGQAASLRQDTPLPATSRGVLLMPAAVDAILSTYLRPHLIGRSIREGTSIFSMDDLARRRLVLPEHLDVLVDTTLPYALATAPCSSDGVPAGRAVLIAGGRLMSPLLDPATAAKMGLPPTPSPRGAPHLLLRTSTPTLSLGSALAAQADGVIVRGLPGLHTQRVGRRDYALVVPDAQAVVGGRAAGRCAVRIGGNPFEQLRSPSTRLVAVPGEWNPGLLVFDGVRIEPA